MRIPKIIKLLKGLFQQFTQEKPVSQEIEPIIIPRNDHCISRKHISANAIKVLYRLHEAGFSAYLVGGCVRDLLLGHQPKDFDIATNALPEEIRKLFRNCRLIGKRFRLAHILFGREIIEVATFRSHEESAESDRKISHKGMIIRDNVFGPIEHDAYRRDFTVNALYYNIADFSVVDYTNAMADIKVRSLRMIGNAEKRFHEDPVRLLRAVRFAGKLNLTIHPETEIHLKNLSYLLREVSPARLFTEVIKFFEGGSLLSTFKLLSHYKLLEQLFPQTAEAIAHQPLSFALIELALTNTDKRIASGKSVSPAFLFAVFLWHPVRNEAMREEQNGFPTYVAYERAIFTVLKKQVQQLAITKRLQVSVRDICFLQHRLTQRQGSRPYRVLEHPRFRAGYDLLMLRNQAGEDVKELFDWWTAFQQADPNQREILLKKVISSKRRRGKKPKKQPLKSKNNELHS